MSSSNDQYPTMGGRISPSAVPPHYGTTVPNAATDIESARNTRCTTGVRFITRIHGILNVIIIISLLCVIISAGVADRQNGKQADSSDHPTSVKVSAYHTRNAVLVFAIFGLILILIDTVLHMTALINRLPANFDLIFIIIMLVLAGIYLILGFCAAAWEKKMNDTVKLDDNYKHKGAAAAASFFLFVALIAIVINFLLRLLRPTAHSSNS